MGGRRIQDQCFCPLGPQAPRQNNFHLLKPKFPPLGRKQPPQGIDNDIQFITSSVWPLRISRASYPRFPSDCPVFNTLYRSSQNIAKFKSGTIYIKIPAPKKRSALQTRLLLKKRKVNLKVRVHGPNPITTGTIQPKRPRVNCRRHRFSIKLKIAEPAGREFS